MGFDKDRFCECCKQTKKVEEFQYLCGKQCKQCYKNKERAKHRRLWKTSEKYRRNSYRCVAKYRKTLKGRLTRRRGMKLYMRKYVRTPKGKEVALRSLYKFMDNHPYYHYEYIWGWIKHHERTLELDYPIFDDGRLIKSLMDFIPNKKALTPLEILVQREEEKSLSL